MAIRNLVQQQLERLVRRYPWARWPLIAVLVVLLIVFGLGVAYMVLKPGRIKKSEDVSESDKEQPGDASEQGREQE